MTTDAELGVDAAVIVVASVAIAGWSFSLALMTALVPSLLLARMLAWAWARRATARDLAGEAAFLALCTALGGFNDWSSVVRHRIYDYTVPHYVSWSTIPVWMLLFWGLILRFLATLARWHRLDPPPRPADTLRLGGRTWRQPWLRVAALLVLVAVTRQTIYRFYIDPWLSWLPFAGAAALFWLLFGVTRHDRRLALVMLVVGPLVEVLYIQVGGLHRYHLGWLGGVPLWIALWWVIAVLVWKDLSARVLALMTPARPRAVESSNRRRSRERPAARPR
jgi:hypothetical protein